MSGVEYVDFLIDLDEGVSITQWRAIEGPESARRVSA
jgi:hypothetical protein